MFKFLKESIKEFDHVVWPTNKEAKKYFYIVTGLIVVLTLFLYVVGTIFSGGLFTLKDMINPAKVVQNTQNNNLPTNLKLGSGSDTKNSPILDISGATVVPKVSTVASGTTK